jgi:Ni,Fe-hydrogenase III small subunit
MIKLLQMWLKAGNLTANPAPWQAESLTDDQALRKRLQTIAPDDCPSLGRSILIRHLDVGSNNAEEAELIALSSPYYDMVRFGLDFTASPRHADVLAVTGPVTRQLKVAMERTYDAAPRPCLIAAIGDGACYGTPYTNNYACLGPVDQFLPVHIYVPGNPPSPQEILTALLKCKAALQSHG